MLSKNKAKFIKSLQDKKYRNENSLFLVEGAKSTIELLQSDFKIKELYCSEKFSIEHEKSLLKSKVVYETISEKELNSISSLTTNNACVAVVHQKEQTVFKANENEWVIVLDTIQDPGNLGTIIRIADWYGIFKIICSETTADFYNPKVISATMGSFTRVSLYYENIESALNKTALPIYTAHLNGDNLHQVVFPKGGFLIMGNESSGISESIMKLTTKSIKIPRYGKAESLNVATATAIICDAIRRS